MRVHEAVLASGDSETGVSIHLVDAGYDTGPVLAQCRVPVMRDDSVTELAARVQAREREFLVETLAQIAAGTLDGGPRWQRP
jgi:phosphoribosylglycinamide formyltransferase-1